MTRPVRFDIEARLDLSKSGDWFEEQAGRRADLLAAVARTLQLIGSLPGLGAPVPGLTGPHPIRRVIVAQFPFWLIYVERPEELYVVAFAHQRREPGFWVDRLKAP